MTFIYVPDKRARIVRIDNNFYTWLNERTIRDKKVLNKVRKTSTEEYFNSFEEGTRHVFNKYLEQKTPGLLTKVYKRKK